MCAVQKQLPGDLKPLSALFQQLLTEAGQYHLGQIQGEGMHPSLGLSKCEPWRLIVCLQ